MIPDFLKDFPTWLTTTVWDPFIKWIKGVSVATIESFVGDKLDRIKNFAGEIYGKYIEPIVNFFENFDYTTLIPDVIADWLGIDKNMRYSATDDPNMDVASSPNDELLFTIKDNRERLQKSMRGGQLNIVKAVRSLENSLFFGVEYIGDTLSQGFVLLSEIMADKQVDITDTMKDFMEYSRERDKRKDREDELEDEEKEDVVPKGSLFGGFSAAFAKIKDALTPKVPTRFQALFNIVKVLLPTIILGIVGWWEDIEKFFTDLGDVSTPINIGHSPLSNVHPTEIATDPNILRRAGQAAEGRMLENLNRYRFQDSQMFPGAAVTQPSVHTDNSNHIINNVIINNENKQEVNDSMWDVGGGYRR